MAEHAGILERVARSHARGAQEREDLRRELAFQVWSSVGRFDGAAKATTWIYRVCLNTALTWRRSAGRRAQRVAPLADVTTLEAEAPSPAAVAEDRDLREHLFAALRDQADADRALLLLHLDGLSYQEMGEVLGMTENHVGVALSRARQRLAGSLRKIRHELDQT